MQPLTKPDPPSRSESAFSDVGKKKIDEEWSQSGWKLIPNENGSKEILRSKHKLEKE
jgi:hypothetical protein